MESPLYRHVREQWHREGMHVPTRSVIAIPFALDADQAGVFFQRRHRSEAPLAAGDVEFAETVIRAAVTAVQRTRLIEATIADNRRLEQLAHTDPLTRTLNRRALMERLGAEMERVRRYNTALSLLLIDIDHFKNFNDTYGHEVGDLVIRKLGRLLDRETRDEDIACRFGGEEFLLIMPRISLPEAIARAEAIKDQVKKLTVRRSGGTIGISAGVAVYPQDGVGSSEILRAVDAALYQAKRNGRGIVRAASAPDGGPGAQGPEPTVWQDRGLAGSGPPPLHPIRLTQPPHPPTL
jgi:two-component system cell cycle response regulator